MKGNRFTGKDIAAVVTDVSAPAKKSDEVF
jgi:hypothetical protein